MYEAIFEMVKAKLSTINDIKWIEWYLEQENQKGGIINTPCILVKFEPTAINQVSKSTEQADINFELLIYTDFKKSNSKVGSNTSVHSQIEKRVHSVLSNFERTNIEPIERKVGLLKSSMTFIDRTTTCVPQANNQIISTENITPEVHTTG